MKKFKALFLPLALMLIILGCENNEPKGMSDAELVQAIIDAETKTEVPMEALPAAARGTMEDNYLDEYLHLYSMKASMLGYEVSIAGRATNAGKRGELYFNIDGRKLDPNDYNDDYKDWYGDRGDFDKDEFGEKREWNCFEILYPYTIMMPNGTIFTIESEEDIDLEEVESYLKENQLEDVKPTLVFPVNIIGYHGETEVVDSEDELKFAYRECSVRDRDWARMECFELVFPVTYIMPDGSTYVIASGDDESGWEELKAWYDFNPNSDQRPELQYPVDIISWENEESVTISINNEEEMITVKQECREMWGEESEGDYGEECYAFVYPISYVMPDGSVIEITTDEDESGWIAIREYYQSNPSEESEPSLQYPVGLIFRTEDGNETIMVSSDDELDTAEEECRESWGEESEGDHGEECYAFVYPISYVMPDGSVIEITTDEDESGWIAIREYYQSNPSEESEPSLQYPLGLIFRTEDGNETITVSSDNELDTAEEEWCQRPL